MSEHCDPAFETCPLFDIVGDFNSDAPQPDGIRAFLDDALDHLLPALGFSSFGDDDNAEAAPLRAAFFYEVADRFDGVGYFGDENNVSSSGDAGFERQPSCVTPHDFDDHDAMVRHCRGMDSIDGFGGDVHGRIESEGDVCAPDIVVDGLGYAHDPDALLAQLVGDGHRPVSADADDVIEAQFVDKLNDVVGDVGERNLSVFAFHGPAERICQVGSP